MAAGYYPPFAPPTNFSFYFSWMLVHPSTLDPSSDRGSEVHEERHAVMEGEQGAEEVLFEAALSEV